MHIGNWTERWAQIKPEAEVIADNGVSLTWKKFNNRINKAAHALESSGAHQGSRVALLMANNHIFLETLLAAAKAGCIAVPLNFRLAVPELEFIMRDATPSCLVYSPEFEEQAKGLAKSCSIPTLVCESDSDHAVAYETWIKDQPVSEPEPEKEVVAESPCLIMYTSGTTGHPKGALLTHRNMIWNAVNSQHFYGFKGHENSLCNAPLFHIGSLNIVALPLIYSGCRLVLQRYFDPSQTIQLIKEEKITFMFGVPTMFEFMRQVPEWESADFSNISHFVVGGSSCSLDLIDVYLEKGASFIQGYGLTETAAGAALLAPEFAKSKLGSAGRPLFHEQLKIIKFTGEEAAAGEIGEIVIKGPNVIKEYWQLPEQSAESIIDGWLHSGDMGYLDEDGFLYITDRKKDMYISGGENVYPAEIERILYGFPQIQEVVVIGIPDEKWGETGLAVVVPSPGEGFSEQEFFTFCKQNLAGYKRPGKVVVADQPLPRTATGKIMKEQIKQIYV